MAAILPVIFSWHLGIKINDIAKSTTPDPDLDACLRAAVEASMFDPADFVSDWRELRAAARGDALGAISFSVKSEVAGLRLDGNRSEARPKAEARWAIISGCHPGESRGPGASGKRPPCGPSIPAFAGMTE
jgi:hypothetical protein